MPRPADGGRRGCPRPVSYGRNKSGRLRVHRERLAHCEGLRYKTAPIPSADPEATTLSTEADATLALAQDLIRRPSVSPEDHGCLQLIGQRLEALGFRVEQMPFGPVENLWARHGSERPVLCFAGHTDVVPTGPREEWQTDPFEPVVRDGILYGRGAADMKSG